MAMAEAAAPLTAEDHARTMAEYSRAGEERARALGNRGPIRLDADGRLAQDILDAYWTHGFYVFEGVAGPEELAELRADVDAILSQRAPVAPGADGRPARAADPSARACVKPPYRWARPLSDPVGGTDQEQRPPSGGDAASPSLGEDAPAWTVELLDGNLSPERTPACRLYGHPGLLAAAASILGDDFVPYNEVTFVKEARPRAVGRVAPGRHDALGRRRTGTMGAHGFNFMTQLYPSTAGERRVGAAGQPQATARPTSGRLVAESGSDRIDGAQCRCCAGAGDTIVTNRQLVHGSFANSSPDRRVTLNAGFFPRKPRAERDDEAADGPETETYDGDAHVEARGCASCSWRSTRAGSAFPQETSYVYRPLAGRRGGEPLERGDAGHGAEELQPARHVHLTGCGSASFSCSCSPSCRRARRSPSRS
jgi:hypothetical protein